ncbi:MAG: hypothetical protein U1F34_03190 [Gammaproteobacteria bacterium]
MKKFILATAMLLVTFNVAAAEEEKSGSYDISDADRELMHTAANQYDACLHEQSDKLFATVEDVREVADQAMKACESTLTDLDTKLAANGVAEDFRFGYIRHAKASSVRRLLPELMARKAAATENGAAAPAKAVEQSE